MQPVGVATLLTTQVGSQLAQLVGVNEAIPIVSEQVLFKQYGGVAVVFHVHTIPLLSTTHYYYDN